MNRIAIMNFISPTRRDFIRAMSAAVVSLTAQGCSSVVGSLDGIKRRKRPNILLAISDDQSWPHASTYGSRIVKTPVFDRIAQEGILFIHGYCPAPQCSPSRAALLTGRNIWQLEEAGVHCGYFPTKFKVYPDYLEDAGYHAGYTGKGWSPGNWKDAGRKRNPAGPSYNKRKIKPPAKYISNTDYAGNFEDFLEKRPEGKPFCFWYGGREPHRAYEEGAGLRSGKKSDHEETPAFLPDNDVVRNDMLDYAFEIEWFDMHLGRMVQMLEERGELDNTLIIVTGDNGMPFPRAKANLYDKGTHVPLAIRWGEVVKSGRIVKDFVSFIDFAPTFLAVAGLNPPPEMTGRNLVNILTSKKSGWVDPKRDYVLTGMERHNHARPDNVGYPCRAIRVREYLYIRNFKPDRWPVGDPPDHFGQTKHENPTKTFLIEHKNDQDIRKLFNLSYARRGDEELYALENDPDCMFNLAAAPEFSVVKKELRVELERVLIEQKDPRVLGYGDIFESYPYFGFMQEKIPGFKERGRYNLKYLQQAQSALKKSKR
jgi:N-sulfoglucosamine sulfohydrolase